MTKTTLGPTTQLYPMPALLVAVNAGDAGTGVLTIAWAGIVGGNPPTMALEIGASHYSTPFIEREGCFTVNVPSQELVVEVDYCGMVTGKKDADKVGTCGFTLLPSTQISAPLIAECPLNFECRVMERAKVGQFSFYLAEIVETHVDEEALVDGAISGELLRPLVFCPDGHYYALGERLAKAWDVGKSLRKDA